MKGEDEEADERGQMQKKEQMKREDDSGWIDIADGPGAENA